LPLSVAHAAGLAVEKVEKTLNVDLAPKIEAAMAKRERFAVHVPHDASTLNSGNWERSSGTSTWRYSVRIPTAVSLSFQAGSYRLPRGASLTVIDAGGGRVVYTPEDGGSHGLWSRTSRGDTLWFELRVPTRDESQVEFAIVDLQAGYRGLGGGAPNHPHYQKLQNATQAALASSCVENFACHVTPENSANGDATAAIVIGGVALCTATLVGNLRNDGTPYLLSARHCQDTPQSGVVVYWDAVAPCGGVMGSFYDTQSPAQYNVTDTVFEQQDTWLLRLTAAPNANRVHFAGWDATGGTFIGGYSPHHALGTSRQYAEWTGQAHLMTLSGNALDVMYESIYWGVVNSVGSIGSGASGGALFNPEDRLVGVASLAYLNDLGEGRCPVTPPPVPDDESSTALYNALSAVWETNADTTSITNPVTLKSLLDPDDTGHRISDGLDTMSSVTFTASFGYSSTGTPIVLSWNGGDATACAGSGGTAGDGWTGAHATSGTFAATSYEPGIVTYTLYCSDGPRVARRSVQISWAEHSPYLFFGTGDTPAYQGDDVKLYWHTNLRSCMASGGTAGDGWTGAKNDYARTQDVRITTDGVISYTITCGSGAQLITRTIEKAVAKPFVTLESLSNNMRIGNEAIILQGGVGKTCTRGGGAPGDGWTNVRDNYPFRAKTMTPGTYRYTLTCEGGPTPAVANLDLTFTNDPPAVTLTPSKLVAETIGVGPIQDIIKGADYPWMIYFSWQSNVGPCQLTYDGPGNEDGAVNPQMDLPAMGKLDSAQTVVGDYVYRITCVNGPDTATATATVQFVPPAPRAYLSVSAEYPAAEEPLTLYWGADTSPCTASGGMPGDGWAGPLTGSDGSLPITFDSAGNYTYTLTCGTTPNVARGDLTISIGAPAVQIVPSETSVLIGRGVILRWESSVGPCVKTLDWADATEVGSRGFALVQGTEVGTRSYGMRCGRNNVVSTTVQVTYKRVPTVTISASPQSVSVNKSLTLTWSSEYASNCRVPGTQFADWNGELPTSGSRLISRSVPGTQGFYIECDGEIAATIAEWTGVSTSPSTSSPPTLNFTIDATQRKAGQPVKLSWTSTRAAVCRGSLGVNGDGWAGTLPTSGTRSIVVDAAGVFTWALSCTGAPPAATASVSATYTSSPRNPPSPPSSGGGSGGGGGGGTIDLLMLVAMGTLLLFVCSARRRRAFSPISSVGYRTVVSGGETAWE